MPKSKTIKWHSHPSYMPYHNRLSHPLGMTYGKGLKQEREKAQAETDQFYSPSLTTFAGILSAHKHSQERHKQIMLNIIEQMQQPYRTPFEQAAYDEQFRTKNRVSGPDLGSSLTPNINETRSDRDILVAIVCLVAFISLLIVV